VPPAENHENLTPILSNRVKYQAVNDLDADLEGKVLIFEFGERHNSNIIAAWQRS
jgi:hypothetical protein